MKRNRSKWWKLRKEIPTLTYATRFFECVDSPVSLGAYLRVKHGEFDQLAEMSVDALDYANPADFYLDYQAVKLVSKLPTLPTSFDREKLAFEKFTEAEKVCEETNRRLIGRSGEGYQANPRVNAVFHRAQRKIAAILGDVPDLADLDFRFGPGAAYGVRGETSVYNKVLSTLECTDAMLPRLEEFLTEFPGWIPDGDHPVDIVPGSELTFVPKSAKIHRSICIEPLLNGLWQKGVGSFMRKRLRRWGVNLDDQSVNQKLASVAHVEGLSTIDFSSASDTIAYGLVLDLLPIDWVEFLDVARCSHYEYRGELREFHKFSSMGNAYTFELETLIFYALACGSMEAMGYPIKPGTNLSVYGDDVIIPRAVFDLFQEVCDHAGFSINLEKSFRDGPFFESCGCDYYLGTFVRPILLKRQLRTIGDLYYAANAVLEIQGRVEALTSASSHPRVSRAIGRLDSLHRWVVSRIPERLRFLVPYGSGDGGLVADFDVATPAKAPRGWCGYRYRSVRDLPVKRTPPDGEWPLAYALYHAGLGTTPLCFVRRKDKVRLDIGLSSAPLSFVRLPRDIRLLSEMPDDTDKSLGYTVRGHTRPRVIKSVWQGHWPQGPFRWSEGSLKLCKRKA